MTPEPEWVDLGLPSGLLWAKTNLGSPQPELEGKYYSWGNTEGHIAGDGYDFSEPNYEETPGFAVDTDLTAENDAATVAKGEPWRMPSTADFEELVNGCDIVWGTLRGKPGRLFTSKVNGRSIFLPACGFMTGTNHSSVGSNGVYWASSIAPNNQAHGLDFYQATQNVAYTGARRYGFQIRAVRPA